MGSVLELSLEKRFPGFHLALELTLAEGEVLALLGPSGSGKSTLLRLVAGLLPPDRGFVRFQSEDLTAFPPERRKVGFLFQDYALFPHLTVAENIAFGLVEARWPKEVQRARVEELLLRMELTPHARKRPQELSGGEQQRVALARALAKGPKILILDDALSAVDTETEARILQGLKGVLGRQTTFLISHRTATLRHADWIIVLDEGRIVEEGTHESLLEAGGLYAELDRIQRMEVEGEVEG